MFTIFVSFPSNYISYRLNLIISLNSFFLYFSRALCYVIHVYKHLTHAFFVTKMERILFLFPCLTFCCSFQLFFTTCVTRFVSICKHFSSFTKNFSLWRNLIIFLDIAALAIDNFSCYGEEWRKKSQTSLILFCEEKKYLHQSWSSNIDMETNGSTVAFSQWACVHKF